MAVTESNPNIDVNQLAQALDSIQTRRHAVGDYSLENVSVNGANKQVIVNSAIVELFRNIYSQKVRETESNPEKVAEAYAEALKKAKEAAYAYEEHLFKESSAKQKREMLKTYQDLWAKQDADEQRRQRAEVARLKEGTQQRIDAQKILDNMVKKSNERQAAFEAKERKLRQSDLKAQQDALKSGGFLYDKRGFSQIAQQYRELEQEARLSGDKESASAYRRAANAAATQDWGLNLLSSILSGIGNTLNKINSVVGSRIDTAMENLTKYLPQFSTRLQGSGKDFDSINKLIKSNLSVSPFIKQTAYLENISKGITQGIAYNVEYRAYLESVKDRIADTFDAFDANLSRLIRIQQADSSGARLGMEASLTRTLNAMFEDTSYLNQVYDTVSGALLDASVQLSREQSVEFEYTVQKWLGSLYSLGLSDAFISQIAQGLNYLGTGNVQALASNSSLQTLFAMAASRANIPYGETLIGGLDAQTTNQLLRSMVEYLQEIAGDTNKVVKSAYGDIFGFSQSDLMAIKNLTSAEIATLSEGNLNYTGAKKELATQLGKVVERMSIQSMLDTYLENTIYALGKQIAEDVPTYVSWKVASLIENFTGGVHLPAISVMGNMIDLSQFTVEGLFKSGIIGLSQFALIPQILSSMSSWGGILPQVWGAESTTSRVRGQGLNVTMPTGEPSQGVSISGYVGSGSAEDIKGATLTKATEEAQEVAKITNTGAGAEHTFDDLYKALFIEPQPIEIKIAKEVQDKLDFCLSLISSVVKKSGDDNAVSVAVINTETPINVNVNPEIVDYYKLQNTTVPSFGMGLFGISP